jgi:hypothetical protein
VVVAYLANRSGDRMLVDGAKLATEATLPSITEAKVG